MPDRRNGAVIALWILATAGLSLGLVVQAASQLLRLAPGGTYGFLGGADLDYVLLDRMLGVAGYAMPALVQIGLLSVIALLFFSAVRWRRRTQPARHELAVS